MLKKASGCELFCHPLFIMNGRASQLVARGPLQPYLPLTRVTHCQHCLHSNWGGNTRDPCQEHMRPLATLKLDSPDTQNFFIIEGVFESECLATIWSLTGLKKGKVYAVRYQKVCSVSF